MLLIIDIWERRLIYLFRDKKINVGCKYYGISIHHGV